MTTLEAEVVICLAFMLVSVIYIAGVVISWNKE